MAQKMFVILSKEGKNGMRNRKTCIAMTPVTATMFVYPCPSTFLNVYGIVNLDNFNIIENL